MTTDAIHPTLAACANCASPFDGPAPRFCPHCGQETTLHPPSVGEFLHEFVGHYVAVEGALWKTLGLLLLRPGRLTTEYFAGRRRRYVLPLRLYLSASFLFFLAVKFLPAVTSPPTIVIPRGLQVAGAASAPASAAVEATRAIASAAIAADQAGRELSDEDLARALKEAGVAVAGNRTMVVTTDECGRPGKRACNWFERHMQQVAERWKDDPEGAQHGFTSHMLSAAPYAIFVMLPVFAAIVKLAYWNRRMRFGLHVVFSMHMHAFWYLAALVGTMVPILAPLVMLGVALYGPWALHEVYGGRWVPTLLRGTLITVVYGNLLLVGTTFLVVGSVML